MMLRILALCALLVSLSGCLYRMPNDDVICTLPNTNNPHITNERPHSFIPGK